MVSDGTRLREEFLLDPSVTFLNHGSFGATPRAVFERYQEWQLELERQPVLFSPVGWTRCSQTPALRSLPMSARIRTIWCSSRTPPRGPTSPPDRSACNRATRCCRRTSNTARSTACGNTFAETSGRGTCRHRSGFRSRARRRSSRRSGPGSVREPRPRGGIATVIRQSSPTGSVIAVVEMWWLDSFAVSREDVLTRP
jgi:hypothetical protein